MIYRRRCLPWVSLSLRYLGQRETERAGGREEGDRDGGTRQGLVCRLSPGCGSCCGQSWTEARAEGRVWRVR